MYQEDFKYFQCSQPCHDRIYENEVLIYEMNAKMEGTKIPSEPIPRCSKCGRVMTSSIIKLPFWKMTAEFQTHFISV